MNTREKTVKAPGVPEFNNKVFQTLRVLEAADRKRLIRYVHSPYFNQSKTLSALCEWFLLQIEREKFRFTKEDVWKKIMPGMVYDDVNFRKYCSDLLSLIEGFMAHEMIAQNKGLLELETLKYINKNKIEHLKSGNARKARNMIQEDDFQTSEFYQKAFLLEKQYYMLMDYDVQLNVRSNIEDASRFLDLFYWSEKVKLFCTALSRRKTSNFVYQLAFETEIVQYLEQTDLTQSPQLAIYLHTYKTLRYPEETTHYFNLKKMIHEYGSVMNPRDALEIFDSVLNYCTGKINQGDRQFLEEYFEVSQKALDLNVFLINGELAPWRFNNIVGGMLRFGKTEWSEHFVEQYKVYLPADKQQNTYTFNLARIYRYQQKFDKVLHLLRDVEYEDIGYNLISKAMLTITYYELDEFEALTSFLDAFKNFLTRQKNLTPQRQTGYLNLIKYVRRLMRLLPGDKEAIEKLRLQLEAEKTTTVNFEWLFEKITELE
jgi:hypothetical protein